MTTPGCYKITNRINGKFYVGSSSDIHERWKGHINNLNHPNPKKHHNKYLQAAWNKYGEDAFDFEILAICPEHMARDVEQGYLDEIFSHPKPQSISYNMSENAYGPVLRGENAPGWGKPAWNKGLKGAQKAWNKGIPASEEQKRKQSIAMKGKPAWNKGKKQPKITCPWCGVSGGSPGIYRWHMNNCKHKEIPCP